MSVTLHSPAAGTRFTAPAGGEVTIQVSGVGPRRTAVFVNEAVVETGEDGSFACEVSLAPGDQWLVAGLLLGCACVSQRVPIEVNADG